MKEIQIKQYYINHSPLISSYIILTDFLDKEIYSKQLKKNQVEDESLKLSQKKLSGLSRDNPAPTLPIFQCCLLLPCRSLNWRSLLLIVLPFFRPLLHPVSFASSKASCLSTLSKWQSSLSRHHAVPLCLIFSPSSHYRCLFP